MGKCPSYLFPTAKFSFELMCFSHFLICSSNSTFLVHWLSLQSLTSSLPPDAFMPSSTTVLFTIFTFVTHSNMHNYPQLPCSLFIHCIEQLAPCSPLFSSPQQQLRSELKDHFENGTVLIWSKQAWIECLLISRLLWQSCHWPTYASHNLHNSDQN